MLKEFIFSILRPFLTAYAMLRFHSIWGLKAYLQTHPNRLLRLVYGHYFLRRGCFVGLPSTFAGKPCLPHGWQGIFISNEAKIGRDVTIFQQVTIGSNNLPGSKGEGAPVIGDHVYIGAGAKIIGGVTIGRPLPHWRQCCGLYGYAAAFRSCLCADAHHSKAVARQYLYDGVRWTDVPISGWKTDPGIITVLPISARFSSYEKSQACEGLAFAYDGFTCAAVCCGTACINAAPAPLFAAQPN